MFHAGAPLFLLSKISIFVLFFGWFLGLSAFCGQPFFMSVWYGFVSKLKICRFVRTKNKL